jgi:hypothetical protein
VHLTIRLYKALGEELVEVHLHLHMTRCLIKHGKFNILNIKFLSKIMSQGNEEFCDLTLKCRLDFYLPGATSSQTHTQVDGHKLARRGKALTIRRTLLRKLIVALLVKKHTVFDT